MHSYNEFLKNYQSKTDCKIKDEIKTLQAVLEIRNQVESLTQTLQQAGCGITAEELVNSTVGDLITCAANNEFKLVLNSRQQTVTYNQYPFPTIKSTSICE